MEAMTTATVTANNDGSEAGGLYLLTNESYCTYNNEFTVHRLSAAHNRWDSATPPGAHNQRSAARLSIDTMILAREGQIVRRDRRWCGSGR